MLHRLNDKGDNLLTEIPGCPEKRIVRSGKIPAIVLKAVDK
jgi:hypothetical protein